MHSRTLRLVAAGAAAGSAILYYLIGFELLYIGESTTGEDAGLMGFGLTVGTVFVVAAALVLLVRNRWVLGAVGLVTLVTLIGYFAVAGVREPPFEPWGLLIKVLQVAMLAAVGLLVFGRRAREQQEHPSVPAARVTSS